MRREQRDAFVIYASSQTIYSNYSSFRDVSSFFLNSALLYAKTNRIKEQKIKETNKLKERKNQSSRNKILLFEKIDRRQNSWRSFLLTILLTIFSIVSSSSNRGSILDVKTKEEGRRQPRGEASSSFKRMEVRLIVARFTEG